jgi:Amidases related to nicotinamidase
MRILKDNCAGLIIDIQERLLPHMFEKETILANNEILIKGLQILDVPVLISEQYPKGLGVTVEPLKALFDTFQPFEKVTFSCCDDKAIEAVLRQTSKKYVVISGIEAHVCVLQTALDLLQNGFIPVVVEDCVSSRKANDKKIALARIQKAGGIITTCESILFELTRAAGTDAFKAISKLVK